MASYTNYTTQAPKVVPSAASGVSVTISATAWANSAWVELTTGIANPIVCCAVIVNPAVAAEFEVEIGKGAAGAEVVVGWVHGFGETLGGGSEPCRFRIPIEVAANTRLAVRFRTAGTTTTAWTAKLQYYEVPSAAALPGDEGEWFPRALCSEPDVTVYA
jgi:hypothetical protein